LFVVRSEERQSLRAHLDRHGVQTLVHYPIAPHRQQAYAELSHLHLPITERMQEEVLSLPLYPGMSDRAQRRVIEAVNSWTP
jgi:dTDP-4-amino-4,6-dideoxygalactose transaminase